MCESTRHLTSGTELAESIRVLKESRPVEPTLKDFLSSFSWTKVSTASNSWQNVKILWCSSSGKHLLIIWSGQYLNKYGSSQEKPYLTPKAVFVLTWPIGKSSPGCKVVCYISIPGLFTHCENVFVRKVVIDWDCLRWCIRECAKGDLLPHSQHPFCP